MSKQTKKDNFSYCQNEIEEKKRCEVQCNHCKEYYAPLDSDSTTKDVQVILSEGRTIEIKKEFLRWFYAKDKVYFPTPDKCFDHVINLLKKQ